MTPDLGNCLKHLVNAGILNHILLLSFLIIFKINHISNLNVSTVLKVKKNFGLWRPESTTLET